MLAKRAAPPSFWVTQTVVQYEFGGYQITANQILWRSKHISNNTLIQNLDATPGINKNMTEVRIHPQDEMCCSTLGLGLILRDPVNTEECQLISSCFISFL